MKFELSLKSTHQEIIQELKNKLSLESDQDIVKKAVESALQMKNNDLISCLLYTSPSPRDVEESRMPSSA